eukprot:12436145-Prorocentrum_lima.AAC.1
MVSMQIFTLAKSQLAFRNFQGRSGASQGMACTWWGKCKVFWAKPEATLEHEVGGARCSGQSPKQHTSTNWAT